MSKYQHYKEQAEVAESIGNFIQGTGGIIDTFRLPNGFRLTLNRMTGRFTIRDDSDEIIERGAPCLP